MSSAATSGVPDAAGGEPRDAQAAAAGSSGTAPARGAPSSSGEQSQQEAVVLTPSRLRINSKVICTHALANWLTNAVWALLIMHKLNGRSLAGVSWWLIWLPTWIGHCIQIPLQAWVLANTSNLIYHQIGPPPPTGASPGLHLQYIVLRRVRVKSHVIDASNAMLDTVALGAVKVMFCRCLGNGSLSEQSFRFMFLPIWVAWVVSIVLGCLKDRSERMVGSTRDLFNIFLLFVCFKLDTRVTYSWRLVFLIPWMFFAALFLLVWVVIILLLMARVWRRVHELLLPIGFLLMLLSTAPMLVSFVMLVYVLDDLKWEPPQPGRVDLLLTLNSASWFLVWASTFVLCAGLRQKERLRESLLAAGAVWTAHEGVARRMHSEREAAQQRIDSLSEDQVSAIVASMMRGKTPPAALLRVGATLYKRAAAELNGTVACSGSGGGGGGVRVGSRAAAAVSDIEAPLDASDWLESVGEELVSPHGATATVPALGPTAARARSEDLSSNHSADEAASSLPAASNSLSAAAPSASGGRSTAAAAAATSPGEVSMVPPRRTTSWVSSLQQAPVGARGADSGGGVVAGTASGRQEMSIPGAAHVHRSDGSSAAPPPPAAADATDGSEDAADAEEEMCVICYDRPSTCVLLECGHSGFCRRCAHLMFVRPPNECPTCRSRIEQVIELEAVKAVGEVTPVKAAPPR